MKFQTNERCSKSVDIKTVFWIVREDSFVSCLLRYIKQCDVLVRYRSRWMLAFSLMSRWGVVDPASYWRATVTTQKRQPPFLLPGEDPVWGQRGRCGGVSVSGSCVVGSLGNPSWWWCPNRCIWGWVKEVSSGVPQLQWCRRFSKGRINKTDCNWRYF